MDRKGNRVGLGDADSALHCLRADQAESFRIDLSASVSQDYQPYAVVDAQQSCPADQSHHS
jgi:hypothetical protein